MNRAITVGLLTLTALTLSPANAQESEPPVLKPTLQTSGLDDDDDKLNMGRRAVEENLSVREIEKAVNGQRTGRDKKKENTATADPDPHVRDFEERLQHRFGTAVHIRRAANKGRIEVEFYDDSDLERILELLLTDGE